MKRFRLISLFWTLVLLVACSRSNLPQKLDSFVDNAELMSSDYDAEDWQKSMTQYERLIEEYVNSRKEYTPQEKQMAARAIGRYHSLLIKYSVIHSATYLKELESILPSYLEGLIEGLSENPEELGRTLEGIINREDSK